MNPETKPSRQEIELQILTLEYLERYEEADLLRQSLRTEKLLNHRKKQGKSLKNSVKGD
jgi:hypothetical protein